MKTKLTLFCLTALASVVPALPATLAVTANTSSSGALYSYAYNFSVTGAGLGFDNLFLGSDDLSPLSVAFTFDGAATNNWSWLGNDTPLNYLQFFSLNGSALSAGDTLQVTFTSAFTPASNHFAEGLNSSTSAVSNAVTGVLAPTAVPEPGSFPMLLIGIPTACGAAFAYRRSGRNKTAASCE